MDASNREKNACLTDISDSRLRAEDNTERIVERRPSTRPARRPSTRISFQAAAHTIATNINSRRAGSIERCMSLTTNAEATLPSGWLFERTSQNTSPALNWPDIVNVWALPLA